MFRSRSDVFSSPGFLADQTKVLYSITQYHPAEDEGMNEDSKVSFMLVLDYKNADLVLALIHNVLLLSLWNQAAQFSFILSCCQTW